VKIIRRETRQIPVAEYHSLACPPYLNHSLIRYMAAEGSWRAYHDLMNRAQQSDEDATDAQRLGTIFHLAQEREDWQSQIQVVPSALQDDAILADVQAAAAGKKLTVSLEAGTAVNLRSSYHKAYMDAHKAAAEREGRLWLTQDECILVLSQVAACLENPAIRRHMEAAHGREVTHLAYTSTDIVLKALVDVDCSPRWVTDWKTTRFNTPHSFVREAVNKGYEYQAAHYCTVTGADEFFFVAVTKRVPAEAMIYQVPPDVISERKNENYKLYDGVAGCLDMDSWHSPGWGSIMLLDREGLPI
jgi:hypothetical protein